MADRDLLTLFKYNSWANRSIFDCAARLTSEQLHAGVNMDHGSAFQTILHLLDGEWSWRLISTNTMPRDFLWEVEDLPDITAIDRFWRAENERMLAYVESLDEAALDQEVDYGTLHGVAPRLAKVRQMLLHVVTHSAHHRSELARRLTDCGHSPGNLSLMDSILRP